MFYYLAKEGRGAREKGWPRSCWNKWHGRDKLQEEEELAFSEALRWPPGRHSSGSAGRVEGYLLTLIKVLQSNRLGGSRMRERERVRGRRWPGPFISTLRAPKPRSHAEAAAATAEAVVCFKCFCRSYLPRVRPAVVVRHAHKTPVAPILLLLL